MGDIGPKRTRRTYETEPLEQPAPAHEPVKEPAPQPEKAPV